MNRGRITTRPEHAASFRSPTVVVRPGLTGNADAFTAPSATIPAAFIAAGVAAPYVLLPFYGQTLPSNVLMAV